MPSWLQAPLLPRLFGSGGPSGSSSSLGGWRSWGEGGKRIFFVVDWPQVPSLSAFAGSLHQPSSGACSGSVSFSKELEALLLPWPFLKGSSTAVGSLFPSCPFPKVLRSGSQRLGILQNTRPGFHPSPSCLQIPTILHRQGPQTGTGGACRLPFPRLSPWPAQGFSFPCPLLGTDLFQDQSFPRSVPIVYGFSKPPMARKLLANLYLYNMPSPKSDISC